MRSPLLPPNIVILWQHCSLTLERHPFLTKLSNGNSWFPHKHHDPLLLNTEIYSRKWHDYLISLAVQCDPKRMWGNNGQKGKKWPKIASYTCRIMWKWLLVFVLVVLCYAVLTRPKQVHVEIAVFRGWALAFSFFRFTAFSDFLNFIFEELERFEHSTSLLQHPGVLTSSALPGVLHCNSLSRDHLAPVSWAAAKGKSRRTIDGTIDRDVLEPSVVINTC